MLDHDTKRKLKLMKCEEMIEAYEEQERLLSDPTISFLDRFKVLIDSTYSKKSNKSIQRHIRSAKFRNEQADLTGVHYTANRGITKETIAELRTLLFLEHHQDIILEGPAGSGKTWLACAIGKQACFLEKNVHYYRIPDLMDLFEESKHIPGKRQRLLTKLEKIDLLILDEWLLLTLTEEQKLLMLEILERRYDSKSTIFCTQYDMTEWYEQLGEGTTTDALLDRIVHNKLEIDLGSENMRALRL